MTNNTHANHFAAAVIKSFDFLTAKLSFELSRTTDQIVEFRNEDLRLRITREPMSFMIHVELIREKTGELYILHELIGALRPHLPLVCHCSGNTDTNTYKCLKDLSYTCQTLHEIFAVDEVAFQKVKLFTEEERKRYTLISQYGAIKVRADKAWERKDFESAFVLYKQCLPILGSIENRRLEYIVRKFNL